MQSAMPVIPLAQKPFDEEDWGRMDAAFSAKRSPPGSVDEDPEFRHLFSHIVRLVPAPLGAGPPE
jgi:hypothetical protein